MELTRCNHYCKGDCGCFKWSETECSEILSNKCVLKEIAFMCLNHKTMISEPILTLLGYKE